MYTWLDDYNAIRAKHPEVQPKPEQIMAARNMHQNTEVNIDDNAVISEPGDDTGYWVSAWVWVCVDPGEDTPDEP